MTINELATQIHKLAVRGNINGERRTVSWVKTYLDTAIFRKELGHTWGVMSITLPDGEWLFKVYRYADKPDAYWYWIPDTREQEDRLWADLLNKAKG